MDPQTSVNPLVQFFPFIMMFLVFYLLVIRPQKKEQDTHKNKLAGLKKNDLIVTAGGIHGTVSLVKETTVIIRVDDNVKLELDKTAISKIESIS
jgi:preprotein translocase subunit YajC